MQLLQWRAGLIPKLGLQFIKTTKGRVGSQILEWKELFVKLTVKHKKLSPRSVFGNTIIAKYNYFLETTARLPTVSHSIALSRLGHHSPGGWTTNWSLRLRRQRVLMGRDVLRGPWGVSHRGTNWTCPLQHLCQWGEGGNRAQAHRVCRWGAQGHAREREQMPSPAGGKEEPGAVMQAGGCLPAERLCWKRPQQAERDFSYILTIRLHDPKSPFQTKCSCDKPAVWPGSKQGQQHSGLYKPQHSQQTEGSAWRLKDHIWILSVQFWAHQYRNDADKPKFRRRPPRCLGAGEFVP